jgi:hypothetical protein
VQQEILLLQLQYYSYPTATSNPFDTLCRHRIAIMYRVVLRSARSAALAQRTSCSRFSTSEPFGTEPPPPPPPASTLAPPSEAKIPKKAVVASEDKDPNTIYTGELIDNLSEEFALPKSKSKLIMSWVFDSISAVSLNADHWGIQNCVQFALCYHLPRPPRTGF